MGDGYLRRLLVVGATAVLRMARQRGTGGPWVRGLLDRKKPKAAAVALARGTAVTRAVAAEVLELRRRARGDEPYLPGLEGDDE